MIEAPKTIGELERAIMAEFNSVLAAAAAEGYDTELIQERLKEALEPIMRHRALIQQLAIVTPYGSPP